MPPANADLDDLDVAILRRLSGEGRASLEAIADNIGLRRPSVHARLRRLEAEGVVKGYRADFDPAAVGADLAAFVLLEICVGKGKDCMTCSNEVATAVLKIPEVMEYHTLAGDHDALVKVRARDVRDLERVVMRSISGLPGVERMRTLLVLSTHFERGVPVLPQRKVTAKARRRRQS